MDDNKELVVFANDPKEMEVAQKSLITYFEEKVTSLQNDIKDADANIEIAKKRKWKTLPFINTKTRLEKDYSFYEKIKAALDAGYVIIPNFQEVDVFAIRTTRKNPKYNVASGGMHWVQPPAAQESNNPPIGKGRYLNAYTINKTWEDKQKNEDGTIKTVMKSASTDFDIVDFPFKFVKPQIMERTAEAMEKLIFDDIGILPNRNIRRGDPMVVGRIWTKKGYNKKCISFLITWFVDTSKI